MSRPSGTGSAVLYLARGAEPDHLDRFSRFVESYQRYESGLKHRLVVAFKGFVDERAVRGGRHRFESIDHEELFLEDDGYDICAYARASRIIDADSVCFLNTNSQLASDFWLSKLTRQLELPYVGLVGASGSFESLDALGHRFPRFPNVHLRTNAFMMRRPLAVEILSKFDVRGKIDAYAAESGKQSITRRVIEKGLRVMIVGRNGRGYLPDRWPSSGTFRQGVQENLLVHDNETLRYENAPVKVKIGLCWTSWGAFSRRGQVVLPGERLG